MCSSVLELRHRLAESFNLRDSALVEGMIGASDEAVESVEIGFAVANYIYCCHFLKPRIYNCFAEHFGK